MNPDDKKPLDDSSRNDANQLHIKPEYGEQGEGPGEQPVRRTNINNGIDGINSNNHSNRPSGAPARSIKITDVSEAKFRAESPSTPRFSHGEDDVMQYFTETTTISESTEPSGAFRPQSSARPASPRPVSAHPSPDLSNLHLDRSPAPSANNNNNAGPNSATAPAPEPVPHRDQSAASPTPHKKFNLAATLAIIIVTVAITATAVFAVLLMTQSSHENKITVTENIVTEDIASITCKKSGDEEQRKAAGDASKISATIIANYRDDDLENFSENTTYTYADNAAAAAGQASIKEAYTKKHTDLGLIDDPFNSNYALNGASLTVTHFAESKNLSFENMTLLGIPQTNGTNPDIDAIDDAFSSQGYTCTIKSAD